MSIVIFQHDEHHPPGRLGRTLVKYAGHRLNVRRLWLGESLPPDLDNVDAVVSLGGRMNVSDAAQHPWMKPQLEYLRAAHDRGLPVIGVGLGCQLLATALGGEVGPLPDNLPEIGWRAVRLSFPGMTDTVLTGQPWQSMQFQWHSHHVVKPPPGAAVLASSPMTKVQAFRADLRTYGFQYHFELDRVQIETMSLDRGAERMRAGMTHEQFLHETDRYYDAHARLTERLCRSICDYLIPSTQRLWA